MAQSRNTKQDLFCRPPLPVAHLSDAERVACLRLIRTEGVGPATFQKLINQMGGATQALDALPDLLHRKQREKSVQIYSTARAEAELEDCAQRGIAVTFSIEPGYPAALASVDHPPPLIYSKGNTAFLNQTAVAIVGARRCSAAGAAIARQIAAELGRQGIIIVSGLARGIDGASHEAALATGTVAVLAGGVDQIYPPEHEKLYNHIARLGCLVSEQPPGLVPRGQAFPRRNRIISGLSHGVVVVEAALRSGSLTTARMAADQGREVFAVPGHPLDPRAEGTNGLIKQGAQMVTSAQDVLNALSPLFRDEMLRHWQNWDMDEQRAPRAAGIAAKVDIKLPDKDDLQAAILSVLGAAPISIDELCRATGLRAAAVQLALTELELAGFVEYHGYHLVSLRTPG